MVPNMKFLVIEDDENLIIYLSKAFKEAGHLMDCSNNGREGLALALKNDYNAIVLDRMLPEMDGFSFLQEFRAQGHLTPVIILSALSKVDDRISGLKKGADDYLPKPFVFAELMARLEALVHRSQGHMQSTVELSTKGLTLNLLTRQVIRDGQQISLQTREFKLLELLMRHKGQIVTRSMLLEKVWEYHFDPQTNVIDVHISRLRQKIDKDPSQSLILTIRGQGYKIVDDN
jgi:two-component system OmpR family response regulator